MLIDPLYSLPGFIVGLLVGMTGIGGGSLMTPLLILLFGVHPATAVGTDLLYAAATKTCGSMVHGLGRTIEWRIVRRLATGSIPAAVATLTILSSMDLESPAARSLITLVLCSALLLTAGSLIFRGAIVRFNRRQLPPRDGWKTEVMTVATGTALGMLVTISSVGAGAIGVVALTILYPALPMKRIVASDITHAVPLTLIAGAGHWVIGTVDWHIIVSLLVGSLPGIVLGSRLALRIRERALQLVLATTLIIVAGKLAYDHVERSMILVTAFSGRAAR